MGKDDGVRRADLDRGFAPARAPVAAHLEQIGEVALKGERQPHPVRPAAKLRTASRSQAVACQMNWVRTMWIVSRGRTRTVDEEVGVGQIGD